MIILKMVHKETNFGFTLNSSNIIGIFENNKEDSLLKSRK